MILSIAIANSLDALTLAAMVGLGMPEGNPFVSALLAEGGIIPVLALKLAAVVLVVATVRVTGRRVRTARILSLIALSAGIVGTLSNVATLAWWPA